MRRYVEAGNEDRLYGEEADVLDTVAHDVDLAGPRLLGKDAGRLIADATRKQIFALLRDDAVVQRLVKDMARAIRGVEDSISEAERLLAQFRSGSKRPDE